MTALASNLNIHVLRKWRRCSHSQYSNFQQAFRLECAASYQGPPHSSLADLADLATKVCQPSKLAIQCSWAREYSACRIVHSFYVSSRAYYFLLVVSTRNPWGNVLWDSWPIHCMFLRWLLYFRLLEVDHWHIISFVHTSGGPSSVWGP